MKLLRKIIVTIFTLTILTFISNKIFSTNLTESHYRQHILTTQTTTNTTPTTRIDMDRKIKIIRITKNKENRKESVLLEKIDGHVMQVKSMKICEQQDWKNILEPCKEKHEWVTRNTNKTLRTSPTESIFDLVIRPVGFPNEIHIKTHNQLGDMKQNGGDYWKVTISGPVRMHVVMKDQMNGSYVGYFVIPEVGNYTVSSVLLHSMCDGLVDPPLDWFTKGTIQGKFQREGIIGQIDNFLNAKDEDLHFQIIDSIETHEIFAPRFHNNQEECKTINTACGYWKDAKYFAFGENTKKISNIEQPKKKLLTLWGYGDSVQNLFFKSLKRHPLCKYLFSKCKLTYTWTYKHFSPNLWDDRHKYSGDDFNKIKFLEDIKKDLTRDEILNPRSVFLINFGIHITMALQMDRIIMLFKEFIQMLKELKFVHGYNFPLVIWKSTTAPTIESVKVQNLTASRFLTNQRIQLWNSFTMLEACNAGIPVLEVFDISSSHPFPPMDHVHHNDRAFSKTENQLMEYIMNEYQLS